MPAAASIDPSAPASGGAKGAATASEPTRGEQLVARRAAEVKATVPDTSYRATVQVDAALATASAAGGDVALVDLVVKASAAALRAQPRANGAYRDAAFEAYGRVNVALWTPGPEASVMPVLFDAAERTLAELAAERIRLAGVAGAGELVAPDLAGATFAVTDLGASGVDAFTPILQAPQAAGLGVGAVQGRAVVVDGALRVAQVVELTLSADHRILPDRLAAELLGAIRSALETPQPLLG